GGAGLAPLAAPGVVLPHAPLLAAAAGLGAASLTGSPVRQVPLLVELDGERRAGLVLEALRLALEATPLLEAAPLALDLGEVRLNLDSSASIHLHAAPAEHRAARSVSAAAVLAGRLPAEAVAGHIVLLGGAAPETGALRDAGFAPLVPAVQLQAEALEQALTLWLPLRPDWLPLAEGALAALCGLAGALAGAALAPLA
ncbi:CHASE2 domain-containing protein, partial [Falsiroseomonas selenitidurans]